MKIEIERWLVPSALILALTAGAALAAKNVTDRDAPLILAQATGNGATNAVRARVRTNFNGGHMQDTDAPDGIGHDGNDSGMGHDSDHGDAGHDDGGMGGDHDGGMGGDHDGGGSDHD